MLKNKYNLSIFEPFFAYIFETTGNFILIFSQERTSKKLLETPIMFPIYLFFQMKKITFDFVKQQKSRISRCFYIYLQNYMEFLNSDLFSRKNVKNSMKQSNIVWNEHIFTGKPMHFFIALTNRLCPNSREELPFPP